jgi:heparan-alpha-glucosaminide N-acetyltransferase
MTESKRIYSIDIMRGLTLVLMLFVNDLNMETAPAWLGHMKADYDGMGLADWVFPGFLFIAGMAIPFAFAKRISSGQSVITISRHILIRSISLIIIGVLMLNSGSVDPGLTGVSENLWALLMYLAVFLLWNDYRRNGNRYLVAGLKITGLVLLAYLLFIFRSGKPENNGWLVTGWWGIPGIIGWSYLVAAFTYLLCRDSWFKTSLAILFFLVLNILSSKHLLESLDPVQPVLGIIIEGNHPMIVLTGLLAGILIKNVPATEYRKVIRIFLSLGFISLVSGFIFRQWFIISKIQATPSWGMICSGISFMVFILVYWLVDIKNIKNWSFFLKPAGENSLTTYLAPDIVYYLVWMIGVPLFFYKDSPEPLAVVAGSLVWALLMVGFTALLARMNVRLKL